MSKTNNDFDWKQICKWIMASRTIDEIEEKELYPQKKVLYQFSARGHDLGQVILGSLLTNNKDCVSAYYRSRPLLLSLGLPIDDAFAGSLAKSGGFSDGRDIGVVCNLPSQGKATVLPMAGDVGSQYTPAIGWAQAIEYRKNILNEEEYKDAIAVVLGGEGSVATNGFWSSLTIATTLNLPFLFYIEDNGYAISVPSDKQTPGRNIAKNLESFTNLHVIDSDGTDPEKASKSIAEAVKYVRERKGPVLLRLTVPRLSGHSGQDTQAYKTPELLQEEQQNDPYTKLQKFMLENYMTEIEWDLLLKEQQQEVRTYLEKALQRAEPQTTNVQKYLFFEKDDVQQTGGLAAEKHVFPESSNIPTSNSTRINMLTAIRKTLEYELTVNKKVLVFGEDVGPKGGVHAATMGLQQKFGEERVFDTSLSEEGIIGRAVGMAIAGLMPVAEIQFRKYADPATEQLNNCGTIRWRTANRFAAPIIVRMPGGFAKCGDPWHSVSNEVMWIHGFGWQVVYASNAQDAVGLLRTALRSNNPTIFFEHRALLDNAWARRPYPGDEYVLAMGEANIIKEGNALTIVTWGAMVERCLEAVEKQDYDVEIIDLRTLSPWDKETVISSLQKTKKCLIVHEDNLTAGFGAEISATLVKEAFFSLDAPIERIAVPNIPIPYNVGLMEAVIPNFNKISQIIKELIEF